MIDMTAKAWFNSALDLVPGREIYRSDRTFQLSAYTASHSQLLLRSDAQFTDEDEEPGTTIELLFKPVEAVDLRSVHYSGLTVRCATPEEAERIEASRTSTDPDDEYVFMLESQGQTARRN